MVERHHRSPVTLFVREAFAEGARITLDGDPAHHARVRRIDVGDLVRLVDGAGHVGAGRIEALGRNELVVDIHDVAFIQRPIPLDMIVPVADRDRMLLAAEKCVELQVTSWRPAYFARSRSVTPRGEGDKFHDKVVARMQSALEQSGSAWLPDCHLEVEAPDAFSAVPADWDRLLLDVSGRPVLELVRAVKIAIAVGPEGGMEPPEIAAARDAGWQVASLGTSTLRFETAIMAGAALARAAQLSPRRT